MVGGGRGEWTGGWTEDKRSYYMVSPHLVSEGTLVLAIPVRRPVLRKVVLEKKRDREKEKDQ